MGRWLALEAAHRGMGCVRAGNPETLWHLPVSGCLVLPLALTRFLCQEGTFPRKALAVLHRARSPPSQGVEERSLDREPDSWSSNPPSTA